MSLRVPLTSDQTLQTEFHEIERRLRRLERQTGVTAGGTVQSTNTTIQNITQGGAVNLQPVYDRLTAIEQALAALQANGVPVESIEDYVAVGPDASKGAVPDPGIALPPTGVAQHVLTEDNYWGFPFRGLLGVVSPGNETDPTDSLNLLGDLGINGNLSSGDVACKDIYAAGNATVGAFSARLVSKAAAYTATTDDHVVLVDASSGNVTVTLPAVATCQGLVLHVKKTDSSGYYVRLDGNSSETIDGDTTFDLLLQGESLMIQSSGARWNVL